MPLPITYSLKYEVNKMLKDFVKKNQYLDFHLSGRDCVKIRIYKNHTTKGRYFHLLKFKMVDTEHSFMQMHNYGYLENGILYCYSEKLAQFASNYDFRNTIKIVMAA